MEQRGDSELREAQRQQRAQTREQQILREQLPDNAGAARAQRTAKSDLPLPRRRTREQQIGHVGAGNQQHQAHRSKQHQQGRARKRDHLMPQRQKLHAHVGVVFRKLLLKACGDPTELGLRSLAGDPLLQAGERDDLAIASVGPSCGANAERNPHIDPLRETITRRQFGSPRELKLGRHDTHHGVFYPIEIYPFADDGGIAGKLTLPQSVTDYRHSVPAGGILFLGEPSAQPGRYAEQGKEIVRDAASSHSFGSVAVREGMILRAASRHRLERSALVSPLGDVVVSGRYLRVAHRSKLGVGYPQDLNAVRFEVRQGAEQDGIDRAENRGVRPDPQRQRQHRDRGKTGILPQRAGGIAKVAKQILEPDPAALVAGGFLDAVEVAELAAGGVARLVGAHARGTVGLLLQLEMRAHLLGHFRVELLLAEQHAEAVLESGYPDHGSRGCKL